MKSITLAAFLILTSSPCHSNEIDLGYFTKEDLSKGQSGCWYYYPVNKKQAGSVIGLGESANNSIYFIINGKKEMIGNWTATYRKKHHKISYNNEIYNVKIESSVLGESKYSSQYESILTVSTKSESKKVEVFGECGS
jgi:hypothetical protein